MERCRSKLTIILSLSDDQATTVTTVVGTRRLGVRFHWNPTGDVLDVPGRMGDGVEERRGDGRGVLSRRGWGGRGRTAWGSSGDKRVRGRGRFQVSHLGPGFLVLGPRECVPYGRKDGVGTGM